MESSLKRYAGSMLRHAIYRVGFLAKVRLPRIVVVETGNICMLKCPTCPTANAMKRPAGFMTMDTFQALIEQLDWKTDKLDLGYSGEPLLNKQIFKMISLASAKGIPTGFDTNGMELEPHIGDIIESGLKYITISLDGLDQEALSSFREGADFKKIYGGIKKLCDRKRAENRQFPKITLQTIVMKSNESQLDTIKRLATDLNIDKVVFKSLNLNIGFWLPEKEKELLAARLLPRDIKHSRYTASDVFKRQKGNNPCIFPLNDMVVLYNGDVILCCLDFNGRHVVGNILRTPLRQIWRSKEYADYRKKVFGRVLDMCKECNFTEDFNKSIRIK